MKNEKPRIVVVGAYRGGEAVRDWQRFGLARLAAICDLKPDLLADEAGKAVVEGFDRPKEFKDFDQMLDWGQFDAVFIATPDATHYQLAKKVMEAGYHCYVEKPMTNSVQDAADLVKVWKQSGVIAVAGHQCRYLGSVIFAKEKINAGVIGTPRLAITMDSCGRMGCYWSRKQWRAGVRDPNNSLSLQKAIHHLDIQTYLLGSHASKVYASAGNDVYGGDKPSDMTCDRCAETDTCIYDYRKTRINGRDFPKRHRHCVFAKDADLKDNMVVTIDYDNGSRGSYVECFFTPDCKSEHTIIGDEGRITLKEYYEDPYLEVELSWIGKTVYEKHLISDVGGHGGADYGMGKAFVHALKDKRQMSPDIIDGFCAVALAKAIDQSAETRLPQRVAALADIGI
ncbi:MAG: Gfo/Idh/MocA family protein [Sedimentisphaerales bacterium]